MSKRGLILVPGVVGMNNLDFSREGHGLALAHTGLQTELIDYLDYCGYALQGIE